MIDTFDLPITFGTAFDFRLGLLSYAIGDGSGASAQDVDFNQAALLTGIEVLDASGREVQDFSITSGSGTFYDADGVHLTAVPEPSSLVLSALGAAVLGLALRTGRRRGAGAAPSAGSRR